MRHKRGSAFTSGQGREAQSKSNVSGNDYSSLGTKPAATSHETWIRRLGVEIEISMKHGRRSQACQFLQVMQAAIRARSPAQQHARYLAIDQAIWGHSDHGI